VRVCQCVCLSVCMSACDLCVSCLHESIYLNLCVQSNTTVTHLQLAGNNIGAVGAVYLKTVLVLNQNITYLVFDYSKLNIQHSIIFPQLRTAVDMILR